MPLTEEQKEKLRAKAQQQQNAMLARMQEEQLRQNQLTQFDFGTHYFS